MAPTEPPPGRTRHRYGDGPFARLVMPPLPEAPGLYAWVVNGQVMYVGQTRVPLRDRLGPNGYATISTYNTFARSPGQGNGGQQTNCRINALANAVLSAGGEVEIWYRVTEAVGAKSEEGRWMHEHGLPPWNRKDERWPAIPGPSPLKQPTQPPVEPNVTPPPPIRQPPPAPARRGPGKYQPLTEYLASRSEPSFWLTFAQLRAIVDLPPSAFKHPQWWANSRSSRPHSAAWLDAGYTAHPNINGGRVRFERGMDQGRG